MGGEEVKGNEGGRNEKKAVGGDFDTWREIEHGSCNTLFFVEE